MTFPDPDPRWTFQEVADTVRRRSLWMEVLGILLILLGVFALGSVVIASVATTFLIGGVLLVAGAFHIGATIAFWQRRRGGFLLGIILGGLCLLSGTMCLVYPAASLQVLTLIIGSYFMASGVARMAINVRERFPGWGWGVASALSELLLGVLTLAWWPNTSLFVLGTILGVQLIFSGTTAFAVGKSVRAILAPRAEPPRTHHHRPATRFQH
jgi:uncharacterized membrane protein HdeD (DUF308 family)